MKNWFFQAMRVFGVSLKSGFQLMYGVYKLSRLSQPIVAVFGGKGAYEEGKYANWAHDLAGKCAQKGMSVITGGGPGIMEAANCGAKQAAQNKKKSTLGIGVRGVDVGFVNDCSSVINFDYVFARKWLLTRYICAVVLFPGGVGTADEFFDVLNLIKLNKMKRVPIILIGCNYWKDLVAWYQHAYEYKLIDIPPHEAFVLTDDVDEAIRIIVASC